MFVLSEIARKRYGQFSLNLQPPVTCEECKPDVKLGSTLEPKALPESALDWLLGPGKNRNSLPDRVMARLVHLEAHEPNAHLKSDYRQAWIVVSFLLNGIPDAFVQSSYQMYGLHPDKVWPSIVADRKAKLGREYYDIYDSADCLRPNIPRIPPTADTPANGADALPQAIGPVPHKEKAI